MNAHIVRNYAKAVGLGSKYVYQAIPRMLTLWLDLGENPKTAAHPVFSKIHGAICQAVESVPAYKARSRYTDTYFSTAEPRDSGSRRSLKSCRGWDIPIKKCILSCQRSSARSSVNTHTKRCGSSRPSSSLPSPTGRRVDERSWTPSGYVSFLHCTVVARLRYSPRTRQNDPTYADTELPMLITQSHAMTEELLKLCNHPIDDDRKTLNMKREFPKLASLGKSRLLIPLQESLTANLPPASSTTENSTHVPFPSAAPTFEGKGPPCFTASVVLTPRSRVFGRDRNHAFACETTQDHDSRIERTDVHVPR